MKALFILPLLLSCAEESMIREKPEHCSVSPLEGGVEIRCPDGSIAFVPDGMNGLRGSAGERGRDGAQGEEGISGETGATGEDGERGLDATPSHTYHAPSYCRTSEEKSAVGDIGGWETIKSICVDTCNSPTAHMCSSSEYMYSVQKGTSPRREEGSGWLLDLDWDRGLSVPIQMIVDMDVYWTLGGTYPPDVLDDGFHILPGRGRINNCNQFREAEYPNYHSLKEAMGRIGHGDRTYPVPCLIMDTPRGIHCCD